MEKGKCIAKPEMRCPYYAGGVPPICRVCKHYGADAIEVMDGFGNPWHGDGVPWDGEDVCVVDMDKSCLLPKGTEVTMAICAICEQGGFRKMNDMLRGRAE